MRYSDELTENLLLAVQQASRFRDKPLPLVTIEYWESLVVAARRELRKGVANPATMRRLVHALEQELALGPTTDLAA